MKYTIVISDKDLIYLGNLLNKQPHGEVAPLVAALQPQITAQDKAELERAQQEWFETEQARRSDAAEKET